MIWISGLLGLSLTACQTPARHTGVAGIKGTFVPGPTTPAMDSYQAGTGSLTVDFDRGIASGNGTDRQSIADSKFGYSQQVEFHVTSIGTAVRRVPEMNGYQEPVTVLRGTFKVHWKALTPGLTVGTSGQFKDWDALGLDGNAREFTKASHWAIVSYVVDNSPPFLLLKVMPDGSELPPNTFAGAYGLGAIALVPRS